MTTHKQILGAIYDRAKRGIAFGLDRIHTAHARVGTPLDAIPILHIGGTNGKGSVAAMTECACRTAGLRTGLFTSPHLCRFGERIQVDGLSLSDDAIDDVLERALHAGPELSFFETALLAAAIAFDVHRVEVGILEVGLGGRLDATNIVKHPLATAVTRVALDHTELLGSQVEDIALEKAGIAKPGVPMIVGVSDHAGLAVERESRARGASDVIVVGRDVVPHRLGASVTVELPALGQHVVLEPSLPGGHQKDNAVVAALLCDQASRVLPRLTPIAIGNGIASATWPARLEWTTHQGSPVLLDSAHNPDGIASLCRYLSALDPQPGRRAIVFGVMANKDWGQMLSQIAQWEVTRFFVAPPGRVAVPADDLSACVPGKPCESIGRALELACQAAGPHGVVVVAGSIFLAGAVRALCLGLDTDPPVAL